MGGSTKVRRQHNGDVSGRRQGDGEAEAWAWDLEMILEFGGGVGVSARDTLPF